MDELYVVDPGSGYTKAGLSGEGVPAAVFPSIIGNPRSNSLRTQFITINNENVQLDASEIFLLGDDAVKNRKEIFVNRPVFRGAFTDWEQIEKLLDFSLSAVSLSSGGSKAVSEMDSNLCMDQFVQGMSLMLIEPCLVPSANRERLSEVIFETLELGGYFLLSSARAELYSVARTSGVVVDVGDTITTVVPVHQGFSLLHSLHRQEFAGYDVTKYLQQSFNSDQGKLNLDYFSCQKIKHDLCYVKLDVGADKDEKFELPDGSKVIVSEKQHYNIFEPFFIPPGGSKELFTFDYNFTHHESPLKPLAEAAAESIATSEESTETRMQFFENILLTGGTTKIRNFKERFQKDMRTFLPPNFKLNVISNLNENEDPMFNAWTGGSIFGCLQSTKDNVFTKEEYAEKGANYVNKKFSMFD